MQLFKCRPAQQFIRLVFRSKFRRRLFQKLQNCLSSWFTWACKPSENTQRAIFLGHWTSLLWGGGWNCRATCVLIRLFLGSLQRTEQLKACEYSHSQLLIQIIYSLNQRLFCSFFIFERWTKQFNLCIWNRDTPVCVLQYPRTLTYTVCFSEVSQEKDFTVSLVK